MSDPSAELLSYYAARAPYYDDVYFQPERREDIAFLARYLPASFSGLRVLEVACGTGFWTQFVATTVTELVATDAAAEPLDFARQRPNLGSVVVSVKLCKKMIMAEVVDQAA